MKSYLDETNQPLQGVIAVGLGGNIGSQLAILSRFRAACAELSEHWGVGVRSPTLRSRPVGPVAEQPDFFNEVAIWCVRKAPSPSAIVEQLLRLEERLGRTRSVRGGPRTIDLDLLLCGPLALEENGVVVPHPRMHERCFVLEPLATLLPNRTLLPGQSETLGELRQRAASPEQTWFWLSKRQRPRLRL